MKNQKTYQKSWVMLCIVLVVLTAICTAFIYQSISKESNSNNDSSNLSNVTESMGNNFVKEKTESPSNFLNSNNENKSISEASIIKKSESAVNFPVKSNIDNNEYVNNKNDNTPVNDDNEAQDIEDDEENNNLCDSNWCDDYPDWLKNAPMNSIQNDGWGYPNRQCTSFAAWRLNRNGIPFRANYLGGLFGHANTWGGVARRVGINVDSNPAVGSIAWTARGDYGHVAYVAAVNGDNVTIEDYNTNRGAYGIWTVNRWSYEYIHFGGEGGGPIVNIPEGLYTITSCLDSNKSLDIWEGSHENGANLQLWTTNNSFAQRFWIGQGSGGTAISLQGSGKFLDVEGNSTAYGANVWLWEGKGYSGQHWIFQDAGDGYCYIKSLNGTYLDVCNSDTYDGTNITTWGFTGNANQKFRITPVSDSIPTGIYTIGTLLDTNKSLDIWEGSHENGANLQLWRTNNSFAQRFWIGQGSGGTAISLQDSGKFWDVEGNSFERGANIWLWEGKGYSGQHWVFQNSGDGYYFIRSLNGTYVDICNSDTYDGANVQTWSFTGNSNQKFKFFPWEEEGKIEIPKANQVSYNGKEQEGVSKKPGYYLKNNTAIKPGTYKATAYLEHPEKVTWEDNTIDPKEIIYTIDKAILNASYVSERVDVLKFKPKLEIKVEGFVNGENPETAEGYKAPHLNRTQFDDIGVYTLVPEGGAALNYNFSYTPGLIELFNSSYTAVAIRDDNTKTIEFQFNNFDGFDKKEMLFDWESDTWRPKQAGYKYIINKNFRHYKVINCKSLFAGGSSIENLKYLNTEKTTDMTEMFGFFGDKNKPTQNLDFSNFNTSNVVNMTRMFWFSNIENLDLSSVKAPKLKDAQSMFAECYKLESVDISNLIVDSKPCISWMFENSEKLKTIYVNPGTKWQNGINVTKSIGAFLNCKSLVGEKGTRWEPWDKGITRACVDGLNNQQGYFTAKH